MSDYRIEAATKDEWANRALIAEAKLAKAVEALHIIDALDLKNSVSGCIPDPLLWLVNHMGSKARATLAELEGGE